MKDRLKYIAAMLIFGGNGIFVAMVPLSSVRIVMIRLLLGTFFTLAVYLLARQKPDLAAMKHEWLKLVASGICLALNWVFLFDAFRYASVSVGTLVYYSAPMLVMLLSTFIYKEKLTAKKILSMIMVIAGMLLVNGFSGDSPDIRRGLISGAISAFFYASIILVNKSIKGVKSTDVTLTQLIIALILMAPYSLLTEGFAFPKLTAMQIVYLFIIGILNTGVAYRLYFSSMRELPAQTVALLSYMDPLAALLLSAVILGERMTLPQAIGAALILGGAMAGEIRLVRKAKERVLPQ